MTKTVISTLAMAACFYLTLAGHAGESDPVAPFRGHWKVNTKQPKACPPSATITSDGEGYYAISQHYSSPTRASFSLDEPAFGWDFGTYLMFEAKMDGGRVVVSQSARENLSPDYHLTSHLTLALSNAGKKNAELSMTTADSKMTAASQQICKFHVQE